MVEFSQIAGAKQCEYKSGSVIISQGDPTDFVFYLSSGLSYRVDTRANGAERIYGIRRPGKGVHSVLGLLTSFDSYDTYVSSFYALTDCICDVIPKEAFWAVVDADVELLHDVIRYCQQEYRKLVSEVLAHTENSVANFICQIIYDLSIPAPDGKLALPGNITMDFIAKMSGVTTMTVSRIIKFLKSEGIVSREKNMLIIEDEARFLEYYDGKKLRYGG